MPQKHTHSKRLVVDASIARSAGETTHPTSINCRAFLETIRNNAHRVVMTPDIQAEWKRHRSLFSSRWLVSMFARKQVDRLDDISDLALRGKVTYCAKSETDRTEMLKDIHLLEAALATDQIVSSLNEKDRKRFIFICVDVTEIHDIVWVNPDILEEACIAWLENGASPEKHRKLGYVSGD